MVTGRAADRLLPGQRRSGGSVPRAVIREARIGLGGPIWGLGAPAEGDLVEFLGPAVVPFQPSRVS